MSHAKVGHGFSESIAAAESAAFEFLLLDQLTAKYTPVIFSPPCLSGRLACISIL